MKFIKYILAILVLVIVGAAVFLFYQFNSEKNSSDKTLHKFVIKKGETIYGVAKRLEKEGLIADNFYFRLYIWPYRWQGKEDIKAGTYQVSPAMKLKTIAKILMNVEISQEDAITFPEGWRIVDMAEAFADFKASYSIESEDQKEARKKYKKEFIDALDQEKSYEYDFLKDKPRDVSLEGYLFPDTYRIYRDSAASNLIKKMLANFSEKLTPDLRQEIKKQDKTIFEVITLASIIQKEVANESDMKKVASVYLNRLKQEMNLESDATITYLTDKKDPQPSISDTQIESPYNTYLNPGLPKGPISNPGMAAILAAIYPEKHNYLYFITRLDTGEAIFSKDPIEHVENKEKYLPH
ncbi:MAG: endolytic transglycosylase MltG [Patescibacteria group bacterium]